MTEIEPKVRLKLRRTNFKKIFDRKLASIVSFSEEEGKDEADDLKKVGIEQVKRKGVGIIFPRAYFGDFKFELWIEDPKDIQNDIYSHDEVCDQLEKFLGGVPFRPFWRISTSIIENPLGEKFLLTDCLWTNSILNHLSWKSFLSERLKDIIARYNLSKIIGTFKSVRHDEYGSWKGFSSGVVMENDLLGKRREDNYLFNLARQFDLTYLQLMRLRILSLSAKEANLPVSYDRLAKEVAEFS